jgi:hypothetical protein
VNLEESLIDALRELEREKGISFEVLLHGLEEALASAYRSAVRGDTLDELEDIRASLDPERGTIRHKPEQSPDAEEVVTADWLPAGRLEVGFTAGASTPNNKIGEALERLLATRGLPLEL